MTTIQEAADNVPASAGEPRVPQPLLTGSTRICWEDGRGDAMSASAYKRGGAVASVPGLLGAILVVGILTSCATRQVAPPAPGQAAAPGVLPSPLRGRRFEVISARSRLTVLVYRAGALAALGHNHVVSCRCLSGAVYLPRDPLHTSFDLRIAVNGLTVDDPILRAAEHSRDFPPDGASSARQGTRDHMLGADLLNAVRYPDITLRSAGLRPSPDGKVGDAVAEVLVGVAGQSRSVAVRIHYDLRADEMVITGEFPLKQTDLGLTPYSLAGGALKVRDGMTVRLSLIARRVRVPATR